MLDLVRRNTAEMGYNPFATNNVVDAIEILENTEIDMVITDMNMPGIGGIQLVRYMAQHFPKIPILVITGFPDVNDAVEVMKLGAVEYLVKPFLFDELKESVEKVLRHSEGGVEVKESDVIDSFHGIIGRSEPMQKLYQMIEKTKNNLATVLISGESGTGKELVARAIHYNSNVSSSPFVPVNCGAIPEQLLESELFGHVKGAFTGAVNERQGFFQAANGGTLFLDEITNTSLNIQAKLLRVIQEREITKLGETKSQKVKLRLISASNTNVEELIREGNFREDLYYRLNIIYIHIPPLRERREDIPLLINHFNSKLSRDHDKSPLKIEHSVEKVFETYEWPGNVRELENFIHRMVVLVEYKITMDDLPSYMKIKKFSCQQENMMTLAEVEKQHILKVLDFVGNNKTKAAEILGIDRKTLRSKLK
jgi:two-component system response regulator HydG